MMQQMRSMVMVAAAAMALVAAMTAAVSAQGPGPRLRKVGPGGPGGPPLGFPGLAMLDLSEQQREQVRAVMDRQHDAMRELGERHREAFDAQRAAIETYPVNEDLVRATSQALAVIQTDLALAQARIHGEIWSILTPEQQEQSKKLSRKLVDRRKLAGPGNLVAPRLKQKPQ